MLNNGTGIASYASFKNIPLIPYNIIYKLATDTSVEAESLWKLLNSTSVNALSEPNLTFEEKMAIVWTPDAKNSTQENLFHVFLKPLVPSALNTDESQTQLKIFKYDMKAITQRESILLYEFDVIVNEVASMVYDDNGRLQEKTDVMECLLLNILNGVDIGVGSSFISFTRFQGSQCQSILNINNSKSLYGRSFLLALRYYDDSKKGGGCNG